MEQKELYDPFVKKIQILEKIAANTETQVRFVRKLQLKGLRRVLNETEMLINELAAVNKELEQCDSQNTGEHQALLRAIKENNDKIRAVGQQALQEAIIEQNNIKIRLKNVRIKRNMQNSYIKNWMPLCGRRINTKG